MTDEMIQRFLVLLGEVSYLEQATRTNAMVLGFLEVCRHCATKSHMVSLYAELEAAQKFVDVFGDVFAACRGVTVENAEAYKQIEVQPGAAVDLLYAQVQDANATPAGRLVWDGKAPRLECP